MSTELQQHLQFLADVNARNKRADTKGTVRHSQHIQGVSRYYSEAERLNAERIEKEQPKDILEILAANPKLNAEDRGRHQKAKLNRRLQQTRSLG